MRTQLSFPAALAACGIAYGATMPAALIVNGGDSTLDLKQLPSGTLRRNIAGLPNYATGVAVWGDHAYVTGSGDDRIARIDLVSETVELDWMTLPAFSNPWGVAIRDAHHGYVVLSALNAVQAFDPTNAELVGDPIEVGNWPQGCELYGDRLLVAVTGFDTETFGYVDPAVTAIDLDDWTVEATTETHVNPQDVAVFDGRVFAVCTGDWGAIESAVEVLDASTLASIDRIDVGGTAGSIAIDRDGVGYLGDSGFLSMGIYTFDAASHILLRGPGDPLSSDATSALLSDERRGALLSTTYDFFAGTLIEWSWPGLVPVGADPIGGGPVSMALWDEPLISVAADALTPNPAHGGDLVTLTGTVTNNSDIALDAMLELDLYLPDGSAYPRNPVLSSPVLGFGPSSPRVFSVQEVLPINMPLGDYTLVGRVFDRDGGTQHDAETVQLTVW
ncbi:MAG: hypothetical protein CME06_04565 [Gemmatimonadetes bacterium]|nr:hypothetical protein [Gemmatimonadota bacterium]